jgi:hypothetical protein
MSDATVVRYRTHPEAAEENARLVAAVYAELAETDPGRLRYITYRLADGVTFVHVAHHDGPGPNPLTALPAFAEFQRELGTRCAEGPDPAGATVVGSYGHGGQ